MKNEFLLKPELKVVEVVEVKVPSVLRVQILLIPPFLFLSVGGGILFSYFKSLFLSLSTLYCQGINYKLSIDASEDLFFLIH